MANTGTLYEYSPKLFCFEYGSFHSKKALIFVAGLGDYFNTVAYLPLLAQEVGKLGWSLIQIQMTSSGIGWGISSLANDASEIAKLATYLRSPDTEGGSRETLGIMGHSTGCQDIMQYFTRLDRDDKFCALDFGIIQAPVSDRFACMALTPKDVLDEGLQVSKELISKGHSDETMSIKYWKPFHDSPINAYRFYSLFGVGGDDDFFSPDLTQEDFRTSFGKFDKPLLVIYSGSDQFVPKDVSIPQLMSEFKKATPPEIWSDSSKIIDGALHAVGKGSQPGAMEETVRTVIKFLQEF